MGAAPEVRPGSPTVAEQRHLELVPGRKVWRVAELTAQVRELLERAFRDLWVQGEVSNFRVSPYGHYYFTLKDASAQLRCFVNKKDTRLLRLRPEDGFEITVRGALGVYEARGEYQLLVNYLEPVGLGALQLAFEQLKARLQAEGLFAAAADMIRILRRRYENLHLLLYPVRVQGEGAAEEMVEALQYFNRAAPRVDVIILARGGGSLEDLWAFNEEVLARAIAASKIPVI